MIPLIDSIGVEAELLGLIAAPLEAGVTEQRRLERSAPLNCRLLWVSRARDKGAHLCVDGEVARVETIYRVVADVKVARGFGVKRREPPHRAHWHQQEPFLSTHRVCSEGDGRARLRRRLDTSSPFRHSARARRAESI